MFSTSEEGKVSSCTREDNASKGGSGASQMGWIHGLGSKDLCWKNVSTALSCEFAKVSFDVLAHN